MASNVSTTFHGWADGEQFTSAALRLGTTSHAGIVNDGTDALKSRPGIIPGFGTPLNVTQLGSPAMQVTVKKGTVAQQSTSATGGVYSHSLTSDTNLDIATANATNPRLDAVVATVFDDGTSASFSRIEVLTGTAGASPVLPSALSSPPANTHYYPLAQVRVEAAVTSIVAAKITKPVASGGLPTFGQFTCAPGGAVRGITRQWTGTRVTNDSIATGVTGTTIGATVPAAEAFPGVYLVQTNATYRVYAASGTNDFRVSLVTPGRTTVRFYREPTGQHVQVDASDTYVLQTGPGSSLVFLLQFANNSGTNDLETIGVDPNAWCIVTRIADF